MKALLALVITLTAASYAHAIPTLKPGENAPCITVTHLASNGVETPRSSCLTPEAGKNLVLEFFATDCHYCVQNLPVFDMLAGKWAGKATFRLIGEDSNPKVLRDFFAKKDFSRYEIGFDSDGKIYDAFGIKGTPTMVVIGPNRKIKLVHLGTVETAAEIASVEAAISSP